jgi:hypothetical protein
MPPSHLGVTPLVFRPAEEQTLPSGCNNVEVTSASLMEDDTFYHACTLSEDKD